MVLDSVWSAEGAPISASMAREVAYGLTGGQTGVTHPDACEVVAQDQPDGTVRIMPGSVSAAATSRKAAIAYTSAPWQSYMKSIYEPMDVEIQSTGSSGGRTDVVGIMFEDPKLEGESGEVPEDHKFWYPYVVQNAGNNAVRPDHFSSLGRPFVPLAQVRMPESTIAVEREFIRDIRFMVKPNSETIELIGQVNEWQSSDWEIEATETDWIDIYSFEDVQVPQWATRCQVSMMLGPIYAMGGPANGQFRVRTYGQGGAPIDTSHTIFVEPDPTEPGQGSQRTYLHVAGDISLHSSTSGGASQFILQLRRTLPETRPGRIRIPANNTDVCMAVGRATYIEAPRRVADQV